MDKLDNSFKKRELNSKIEDSNEILKKLEFLYGYEKGRNTLNQVQKKLSLFKSKNKIKNLSERFTEKDVVLITYADIIQNTRNPLQILGDFAKKYLKEKLNTLHILPFFKYDLDRGFSIIDYKKIDPTLGDWNDISELKKDFKLMFDLVINHISDKHHWFQEFKKGNRNYRNYFIWFNKDTLPSQKELEKVFRPRTNPLLTKYNTSWGEKYVWTTFPLNQVDLNFTNEKVLLDIIDILLFYVNKGVDIIRLDAIAFIWKELGTNCLHLKQTHVIVQILRNLLDTVAPHVSIITETNVPHKENIEYFGNGKNEAHIVYNFPLPPLVLYSIYTGSATQLSKWVEKLETVPGETAFFNFLDSHDGIGILGVKDILTDQEIQGMIKKSIDNGGLVSYKKNSDGTDSPYEMNTTWWNALNQENTILEANDLETQIQRYLMSRSIVLSLKGIPSIYLNGLFGAVNDKLSVSKSGSKRDINRKNFNEKSLYDQIENDKDRVNKIFTQYMNLIMKRIKEKAFHPLGHQKILFLNDSVFSLIRISPDKKNTVIALHNVSPIQKTVKLQKGTYFDIITQHIYPKNIELKPYQFVWLKKCRNKL